MNTRAYCDGGILGKNPSPLGGMWAWCLVEGGKRIKEESGFVEPMDLGLSTISNNVTELLAALRCLSSLGREWKGTLHTDSVVTLHRLTTGQRFNGIPQWMRLRCLDLRRRRKYQVELVAGHPTQEELKAGKARRNSFPVSEHNVWCDRQCCEIGRKFNETRIEYGT